jgi:hypothetical protein
LDEAEKSVDYFNSQIDFWKKKRLKEASFVRIQK